MSDPLGKNDRDWRVDACLCHWFKNQMYQKMRKNKHKAHWDTVSQQWLFNRLLQEVDELEYNILTQDATSAEIIQECADVANFAAMIANNAYRRRKTDN